MNSITLRCFPITLDMESRYECIRRTSDVRGHTLEHISSCERRLKMASKCNLKLAWRGPLKRTWKVGRKCRFQNYVTYHIVNQSVFDKESRTVVFRVLNLSPISVKLYKKVYCTYRKGMRLTIQRIDNGKIRNKISSVCKSKKKLSCQIWIIGTPQTTVLSKAIKYLQYQMSNQENKKHKWNFHIAKTFWQKVVTVFCQTQS